MQACRHRNVRTSGPDEPYKVFGVPNAGRDVRVLMRFQF